MRSETGYERVKLVIYGHLDYKWEIQVAIDSGTHGDVLAVYRSSDLQVMG